MVRVSPRSAGLPFKPRRPAADRAVPGVYVLPVLLCISFSPRLATFYSTLNVVGLSLRPIPIIASIKQAMFSKYSYMCGVV